MPRDGTVEAPGPKTENSATAMQVPGRAVMTTRTRWSCPAYAFWSTTWPSVTAAGPSVSETHSPVAGSCRCRSAVAGGRVPPWSSKKSSRTEETVLAEPRSTVRVSAGRQEFGSQLVQRRLETTPSRTAAVLSYCPVNVAVAWGKAAPLVLRARLTGAGGLTWTVTVVVSPVAGTTPRTVNFPGALTAEAGHGVPHHVERQRATDGEPSQ